MEASIANFRALFPEFKDPPYDDAKVQFYLDLAAEIHSCSDTVTLYLAAHMAALDAVDGVGDENTDLEDINTAGEGFGTQQKVGDLSVTYAAPESGSDADLSRTPYGRRAKELLAARKRNHFTVGVYS